RIIERDALAAQILDTRDAGVLAGDDMHILAVEAGDAAQGLVARLPLIDAGGGRRPVGDVGLAEAAFDLVLLDILDVGDRAVGGLDDGEQARHAAGGITLGGAGRVRDDLRNGLPDRVIGRARA